MRDEGGSSDTNFQQDFSSYRVFDEHYEEVGKVDDVFVDGNDRPRYIGIKMGFLGMKSTLVPVDLVRINDRREVLEIAASKNAIENAPGFDEETISPEHEAEIQQYYGLTSNVGGPQRDSSGSRREPGGDTSVDLDYGERGETEEPVETSRPRAEERPPVEEPRATPQPGREERKEVEASRRSDRRTEDDEMTIQRTEEELRAGTREREAGSVNVRRRVRTDREQVRVPKKKEEVIVERVPVEEEPVAERPQQGSAGVESGEEEIRIPVVEEEVVVEKRPVVKEELRIKKRIVEEEEIVEEDVRKEEIDIEGEANYRDR